MSKSKGKGQPPSISANFSFLVKCLYQIIQCLHHRAISRDQVEGRFTKAFSSKLKHLDNFIRPAQPNSNIRSKIRESNKAWALDISAILKQHYEDNLVKIKSDIQTCNVSASLLEQAKTVALRWARQNFRTKLKPSTISAFELEFSSIFEHTMPTAQNSSSFSTTIPVTSPPTSPVPSSTSQVPSRVPSTSSKSSTTSTPQVPSRVPPTSPVPSTSTANLSTPCASKTIPTSKSKTVHSSSTAKPTSSTPKPMSYAEAARATGPKAHTQSIRIVGEHNPLSNIYKCKINYQGAVWNSVEHLFQYQRAVFLDQGKLSDQIFSASNAHQVLKLAGKLPISPLWNKHQLSFMATLLDLKYEQCEEFRVKLHQSGTSKLELKVPNRFWGTGNYGDGENHFGNLLQKLREKVKKNMVLPPKTPVRKPVSPQPFSPDTPVTFKILPHRHPNTNNKNSDWCFPEIREKILILGTSNLSSITESPLPNIQIESYPGARVLHFSTLLDKAEKNRKFEPEHVIISVGMNDKNNNPNTTTIPNLGKLLAKAKSVFPNSKIYMPQVTYSDRLHPNECSNLQTINKFIAQISEPITAITKLPGRVGLRRPDDPVHYDKSTANKILRHWLLNLN